MDEYTPDTDMVRSICTVEGEALLLEQAEFDRWLAEVVREAREKAWEACLADMPFDLDWKIQYGDLNPYRKETQ